MTGAAEKFAVSVVMPALNEETNIEKAILETLAAFKTLSIHGEIVLMNDGSRDRTGEIGEALARKFPNIRVIHHSAPKGIGGSFWEGAHAAQGDVVLLLPGDGECVPEDSLRYMPLLNEVDIVIPFIYNVGVRDRSRRWISRLYKAVINLSFALLLNYMNGTVVYRRSVLLTLDLQSRGFFYQTELLIKAIRRGYLYAEVPCALGVRGAGRSSALTWRSFFKLSRDYLRTMKSVYFANPRIQYSYIDQSMTARRYEQIGGGPRTKNEIRNRPSGSLLENHPHSPS